MEVAAAIEVAFFPSPPEIAAAFVWPDTLAVVAAIDIRALRLACLPIACPAFIAGAAELGGDRRTSGMLVTQVRSLHAVGAEVSRPGRQISVVAVCVLCTITKAFPRFCAGAVHAVLVAHGRA